MPASHFWNRSGDEQRAAMMDTERTNSVETAGIGGAVPPTELLTLALPAKVDQLNAEVESLRCALEKRRDRVRLPDTRPSVTHKFSISGHEGYITVGLYPDGRPGEVFIKMAKQGSTVSGLVDTIAVLTSLALQYGVPIENLAIKFQHSRFEPSGHTVNREIPLASSISDYVFTWLGLRFSDDFREAYSTARASRRASGEE
jgi:ribonucleoside-diphosphate reductase alpha chain